LRYAKFLWGSGAVACSNQLNDTIRKIHDFYGWKAWDCTARRGVCAGALYRSAGYMAIAPTMRDGSQGPNRTVHIEHSVPVAVLVRALRYHLSSLATPSALHDFLIRHSVCAALSYEEERLLKQAGVVGSRNSAFDDEGCIVGRHPFLRYQPLVERCTGFRLFNVVSGHEIQIDQFEFAHHVATLDEASRQVMPIDTKHTVYSLGWFDL
jgi:hypothetical protein